MFAPPGLSGAPEGHRHVDQGSREDDLEEFHHVVHPYGEDEITGEDMLTIRPRTEEREINIQLSLARGFISTTRMPMAV